VAEHDDAETGGGAEHDEREHAGSHFPAPSILPFGFAAGVALLLIGLVINWWIVAIGAGIAIVLGLLWVRDATADYRRGPVPPVPTMAAVAAEAEVVDGAKEPERYTRSKFLEATTLGIGGVIGAVVTIPVVGFAIAPAFADDPKEDNIDLGPLENFPEGEYVVATFQAFPSEGQISRQTAFIRNNGIVNEVPSFTIISNHCVHLGCPTQPNGPTDFENPSVVTTENGDVELIATQPAGFGCPCHGGQYDNEGNRTAGPPVRSLDRYRFSIVDGKLILGARISVGTVVGTGGEAVIHAYDRYYPGAHVDGWETVLYPWPGF
jgi:Rieske Fe-S protein